MWPSRYIGIDNARHRSNGLCRALYVTSEALYQGWRDASLGASRPGRVDQQDAREHYGD